MATHQHTLCSQWPILESKDVCLVLLAQCLQSFGLLCCPTEVEHQEFELRLLLTKPIGVFHPGEVIIIFCTRN